MKASRNVIISPYAGGLGDNLCFSTLPEMYAHNGFKVLIGRPAVEPGIRNPETRRLVWEMNPFVSGFVDDVGITFTHREMHRWIWGQTETRTLVEAMEALHGFKPTHKLPKIYYQPKWRPEVMETIFADPSSISQPISPEIFSSFIDHLCRARDIDRRAIVLLKSNYAGSHGSQTLAENAIYNVADIFEYCDLVASCRLFLTAEGGGAILGSTLRGGEATPEIFSLFTTQNFNDRLFQFPNVRYCVTGKMTDDYPMHHKPSGNGEDVPLQAVSEDSLKQLGGADVSNMSLLIKNILPTNWWHNR
jgi:hypothetical protein